MVWRLLLILPFLVPSVSWAAGAFEVGGADKSMEILGMVFGQMGALPLGGDTNSLFAEMLGILNKIVFFLGIIIVVYTGAVSTIQTAQEGEVMGKKWSTIWVPLRAAFGLFVMLPAPGTTYSYIQIVIMYFVIQGVGAANAVWEEVINGFLYGDSIVAKADFQAELSDTNASYTEILPGVQIETGREQNQKVAAIKVILESELCAAIINKNEDYRNTVGGELITLNKVTDSSGNLIELEWGNSQNPYICGKIAPPDGTFQSLAETAKGLLSQGNTTSNLELQRPLRRIYAGVIESVALDMESVADEATQDPYIEPSNRTQVTNITPAIRAMKRGTAEITNYYVSLNNKDAMLSQALADGWVFAGNYYFTIIVGEARKDTLNNIDYAASYSKPLLGPFGQLDKNRISNQISDRISETFNQASALYEKAGDVSPEMMTGIGVSTGPAGLRGWDETIGKALKEAALSIVDAIHGGGDEDPLIAVSSFGQTMMLVIEGIFWGIVLLIPLFALGSVMSCAQPFWGIITTVAYFLIALFLVLMALLYTASVVMAIYIPLIPWLVYTFSAIAWAILVIEAIVAAPLVALVLVVPSEDEMGKIGHSLVILVGLIFRPVLMLTGFLLGTKLLYVVLELLKYGFRGFVMNNLSGIGIFGAIAIIIIYMGIITTLTHQAFSLIHVIPDKVLRWMGGQPETQDVSGKVQGIKGYAQKGGQAGTGMMKGGAGAAMASMKKGGG